MYRRKYINIATGLILAVIIATNFAFLKDFNISSIWEKSAIEYKRDIFKNAKHKNIAYELNKKASQTLETLKTNKQGIITDNLHLAFKDKEIREIHVKKIDPVKTKLLEEKLWKAIYKIQPLFWNYSKYFWCIAVLGYIYKSCNAEDLPVNVNNYYDQVSSCFKWGMH